MYFFPITELVFILLLIFQPLPAYSSAPTPDLSHTEQHAAAERCDEDRAMIAEQQQTIEALQTEISRLHEQLARVQEAAGRDGGYRPT